MWKPDKPLSKISRAYLVIERIRSSHAHRVKLDPATQGVPLDGGARLSQAEGYATIVAWE